MDNAAICSRLLCNSKSQAEGDFAGQTLVIAADESLYNPHCTALAIAGINLVTVPQVFEQVGRPTIEPVVQGISGTVFAYGVTSSGKTHTMMGTAADPGLVPRAITVLFDSINDAADRCAAASHMQLAA